MTDPPGYVPPETIGRDSTKRAVASDGMGMVYEAARHKPRRVVTVKVMKQGVALRLALRRFEYQFQTLARRRVSAIFMGYEDDSCAPRIVSERLEPRSDEPSYQVVRERQIPARIPVQNPSRPPGNGLRRPATFSQRHAVCYNVHQ